MYFARFLWKISFLRVVTSLFPYTQGSWEAVTRESEWRCGGPTTFISMEMTRKLEMWEEKIRR